MKINNETIGIKEHSEQEFSSPDTMNLEYHGKNDPGEYAQRQENEIASTIRKHRAK